MRRKLNLTVSLGVAAARRTTRTNTLIQSADEALREAKRSGHNRVCIATQKVGMTAAQ